MLWFAAVSMRLASEESTIGMKCGKRNKHAPLHGIVGRDLRRLADNPEHNLRK